MGDEAFFAGGCVNGITPSSAVEVYDDSEAGVGVSYCSSGANSTGGAALMTAVGSNSVAQNSVELAAGPVPNSVGIFFYGASQVETPFANGIRCVSGRSVRLAAHGISGGTLRHQLDLNQPTSIANPILAGTTLNFQAWFRDNAAGGARSDLSNGLEIVFLP